MLYINKLLFLLTASAVAFPSLLFIRFYRHYCLFGHMNPSRLRLWNAGEPVALTLRRCMGGRRTPWVLL